MPEHVSILQLAGVAGLVLVTAAWIIFLMHTRRTRSAAAARRSGRPSQVDHPQLHPLQALPPQRPAPPHVESVELTPAERDAFAGLVRQLGEH
ncbi:hypothetical protein [Streptomyces sp. NPDC058964]|uniref:hypothetical protein n=1 Tax=Streptomyces sp. NPDC058964 TaxID=3346681 RepID=UPI003685C817